MGAFDKLEEDGAVHDVYRVEYLKEHLKALGEAIEEGCEVLAYCFGGGDMDLLEKPVYHYIKKNHGVITFRDMEELNFSYQQLNQLVSKGKSGIN